MGKIYDLYNHNQRKIDNMRRKILGYEKMKVDLTKENRRLNHNNHIAIKYMKHYISVEDEKYNGNVMKEFEIVINLLETGKINE